MDGALHIRKKTRRTEIRTLAALWLAGIFIYSWPSAAFYRPHVGTHHPGPMIAKGVYIGGFEGRQLSVLGLKWVQLPKHAEQIQIRMGEFDGRSLAGPIGYYHLAVMQNPPRLVLDLARVQRTAVDGETIRQTLSSSKLINGLDFTMDPEDSSTNLTLDLKRPVKADAFTKGRDVLVIDLRGVKKVVPR